MSKRLLLGTIYRLQTNAEIMTTRRSINLTLKQRIQSAAQTRKTRIIDVVYNASNNELVRTKTLVKNSIIQIDATPFRQWYEAHYASPLGRKKGVKLVSSSEKFPSVIKLKKRL